MSSFSGFFPKMLSVSCWTFLRTPKGEMRARVSNSCRPSSTILFSLRCSIAPFPIFLGYCLCRRSETTKNLQLLIEIFVWKTAQSKKKSTTIGTRSTNHSKCWIFPPCKYFEWGLELVPIKWGKNMFFKSERKVLFLVLLLLLQVHL